LKQKQIKIKNIFKALEKNKNMEPQASFAKIGVRKQPSLAAKPSKSSKGADIGPGFYKGPDINLLKPSPRNWPSFV
jgi:hypothetical protein